MDRTAWIAIVLATIGLVASIYWQQHQLADERAKYYQRQALLAAQATPSASPVPRPQTTATAPSQDLAPKPSLVPDQAAVLKSDVAELDFSNNRGGLSKVSLFHHSAEEGRF